CLIISKAINIIVPFYYKDAVDHLSMQTALLVVPFFAVGAYIVARIGAQVFGELRDGIFEKVEQNAVREVALSIFSHLHRLSLRFHLERQTGGISRIIERGVQGIQNLLSFSLFNVLPTLVEIALVCGVLLVRYNIWFALVTGVTIIIYIGFTLVVSERRVNIRMSMNSADNEANTKAIDSLINYETVKYFNNEAHENRRYDKALKKYEASAIRAQTSLTYLNIGQGIIISTGLGLVMLMAAIGVKNGTNTVGDFVLVNTFLIQLYVPLNFLGFVYRTIKQSLVDMAAMFVMLDVVPEVRNAPNAGPLDASKGEIEFKDVNFAYDERRPVLKGVSFQVPAGTSVAIVGPSGSGKSTLTRLLYRFYDISAGQILIDGQSISDVTQESLRRAIGIVPQDTVLFNDTILYNIRYGRSDATDDEVIEAAKLAQIHDFISRLPDRYETIVGERGLKLSGGEKQRVAIARTILKNPSILIFDEATSALDTHTEKEIQVALRMISNNKTTLIIAHRLSTVVDADQIMVLDNGHIVERGTHSELVTANGAYGALWRRQLEQSEYEERLARLQDK
ncbi:ABC transporter ATP-binding protein/permease, partial [bacterium]|nr:ABC transporter ATP-binding protein/permease [bacterium]